MRIVSTSSGVGRARGLSACVCETGSHVQSVDQGTSLEVAGRYHVLLGGKIHKLCVKDLVSIPFATLFPSITMLYCILLIM